MSEATWRRAIGRLGNELGAGGAIRVGRDWATPEDVDRIVGHLELEVVQIDLIVDLQYLDFCSPQLVEWTLATFAALRTLGPFRSTTILSGSVPSTLEQTSLWERPRFEEALWRAVVEGGSPEIRLGDYGVVNPGAGAQFPSKHVNLKYTRSDHWLFVRERMRDQVGRGPTLQIVCATWSSRAASRDLNTRGAMRRSPTLPRVLARASARPASRWRSGRYTTWPTSLLCRQRESVLRGLGLRWAIGLGGGR